MKELIKFIGGITLEMIGSFLIGLSVAVVIFGALYAFLIVGWALGFQM